MYLVTIQQHFDAAHFIRGYSGKCQRVHGHRWLVQVNVERDHLNHLGMLVDFGDIKQDLNKILDEHFDHYLINDLCPFDTLNPTAENIAKFIYDKMKSIFSFYPKLNSVRIYESPDCYAEYRE